MFFKYISLDDINYLRKQGYIIIISNNIVYNVTNLIHKHPGGRNSILNNIDKDNYNNFRLHSIKSQKKWNDYKIGVIYKNKCSIL